MDLSDPVYKRIKFEVFEKDSFRCQYCNAVAPNVTLHLHRLQEVQKNENWLDPAFLTTSCEDCKDKINTKDSSKGNSNDYLPLNELEERLEQLKMLIHWRKGMLKIKKRQLASLVDFWQELVPGIYLNDEHKRTLLLCMNKYSRDEIKETMQIAVQEVIVFHRDGSIDQNTLKIAFEKIPEICLRKTKIRKNREMEDLYHIHDILKQRLQGFFDSDRVIQWLHYARSWEVKLDELTNLAFKVTNWTQFSCNIDEMVHRQKYFLGRGRPEPF